MADVNNVTLVGRLTRDLNASDQREFAYTATGVARANISIAVGTRRKNGDQWVDESNYFNVTIFGRTAESLKPYLTKGKQIAVEGSLKQDRWQDQATGKTRDRVYIIANNIQLLGGGGNMNGGSQPSGGYAQNFRPAQQGGFDAVPSPSYDDSAFGGGANQEFQEDIPF
ncbi:MAG: single-stranded DNA-binding protein [Treponema sp.]|nr:single-stranded DNA-binding protein [Treponema sp.]